MVHDFPPIVGAWMLGHLVGPYPDRPLPFDLGHNPIATNKLAIPLGWPSTVTEWVATEVGDEYEVDHL